MNNNTTKIKLVFVPYLIISSAILIGWTYLHWLLFIKLNLYEGNEGALVYIIPFVLSVASIFIWLDKRIDLLKIDKYDSFYLLVPILAIIGSSFFAQQYIVLTTGKITHLSSISQIDKKEPTKFYTLKNFYLDKKHLSVKKQFGASGKYQTELEMGIYITVPILETAKDTLGSNCIGWYGVQYTDTSHDFMPHHNVKRNPWLPVNYDFKSISRYTIENSVEVKKFIHESMKKFNNLNINQSLYWERIFKNQSDYDNYLFAIKNNIKYDTESNVVLSPYNESLTDRSNDNLIYALAVFGGGSLLFLIMVTAPKLKSEDEESKQKA